VSSYAHTIHFSFSSYIRFSQGFSLSHVFIGEIPVSQIHAYTTPTTNEKIRIKLIPGSFLLEISFPHKSIHYIGILREEILTSAASNELLVQLASQESGKQDVNEKEAQTKIK